MENPQTRRTRSYTAEERHPSLARQEFCIFQPCCNLTASLYVSKPELHMTKGKGPFMSSKLMYWSLTLLLFLALGVTFEQPARAYTDPGSALLLFQSIGAVASGVIFYFRRQIKRVFSRSEGKPAGTPAVISRADS